MKYVYNGELDKDVLHLPLFSIYTRKRFSDILSIWKVSTWEAQITTISDMLMILYYEKELSELISKINEVGKQFGIKINIKKTKAMVVSKKPNSPKINIAIDGEQIEQVTSYMYLGSLITEDGRSEKEIKRRIMIARSTFTNIRTIVSRHKPEDQIKSNKMLYLANTILWSRDMDNHKISVVQTWRVWDVGLSQSFKNIMDGQDHQRGSIQKDGNRQRNSETIQDEETTISRTSNKT